jgi:uncharacterized protein (TIGR02001 family)
MPERSRKTAIVSGSHFFRFNGLLTLAGLSAALLPVPGRSLEPQDVSFGGSLALTSDYIYRGLSESDDHLAPQADLHAAYDGTFAGVWASTRERRLKPYADYDLEAYIGHRFSLNGSWGGTLSGRSRYYLGGNGYEPSADYQELSAGLSYLDRWQITLTAIPNAVRYWYYERLSRSPAYVAETSLQWLLYGGLFATGGAGYYFATGTGPGIQSSAGYAYGNVGLAYEYRHLRLDVGYFVTQPHARQLFPYPVANQHFAGTLTLQF